MYSTSIDLVQWAGVAALWALPIIVWLGSKPLLCHQASKVGKNQLHTELYCYCTALQLYCTDTELYCYWTGLLLVCTVIVLHCYFTAMLLYCTATVLHYFCTALLLNCTATVLHCTLCTSLLTLHTAHSTALLRYCTAHYRQHSVHGTLHTALHCTQNHWTLHNVKRIKHTSHCFKHWVLQQKNKEKQTIKK